MTVPAAIPFVVPVIVTVRPNVTAGALALIVKLLFGCPGLGCLGGLAATAGPAQTSTSARAALSFFISPITRADHPSWAQAGKRKERPKTLFSQLSISGGSAG